MRFDFVEIILVTLIVFCFVILIIGLYNSVVSEKITLIKSEWVCTEKESKVSIIGGKVYSSSDCINYAKEK
jgi:hypothetical protein